MNEINARPASRVTFSILWMASCLFGGFAVGSKIHNPLKMTTLHFEKVAAVIPSPDAIQLAQLDPQIFNENKLDISVDFTPFELPSRKTYAPKLSKKLHRKRASPWAQLDRAIKNLKLASLAQIQKRIDLQEENIFEDYSLTLRELRRDFFFALIPTSRTMPEMPVAQITEVQYPAARSAVPVVPAKSELAQSKSLINQTVSIQKNQNNPDPLSNIRISESKMDVVATYSIQLPKSAPHEDAVMASAMKDSLTGLEQTAKIESKVETVVKTERSSEVNHTPEYSAYMSPGLSKEEQKVLKEALLSEQMKAIQGLTIPKGAKKKLASATQKKVDTTPEDNETAPEEYQVSNLIANTRFINSMGIQVNPTSHSWISKNWSGSGWVKVDYDNSLPTLLYYPSPNTGTALLLETNSLAFLGLKSGARIMKGMGVITGVVPAGYEVEFAGRAEEAEYFEVQGKKYFAIINAEPGAGVVELISTSEHGEAATVFAPVLEDTVTYLDLAAPKSANFTVRVVKSGAAQDPEVVGLTIGISTQGKIQGITQTNGRAYLRNVPVVPGYPVYIDVSSKFKQDRGYTYRYLMKNRNRAGEYLVHQIAEKSLVHWIKQVKQGLSDQSAMVVGFFNRNRLGGFKEHHFVKSVPQTAKLGLEPLNFSVLWDGSISSTEPMEGDLPRFMSVQVPEGLSQIRLTKESGDLVISELIPVSPRVIHVVSE